MGDGRSVRTWGGSRALVQADPLSLGLTARERQAKHDLMPQPWLRSGPGVQPSSLCTPPSSSRERLLVAHPAPLPMQPLGRLPQLVLPAASPG